MWLDPFGMAGVYATQLKMQPEVVVQFRGRFPIDKIVIHGKNLNHLNVYWRDEGKQWHLLKSVEENTRTPLVIRAHAVTDAIRIHAQPQRPLRPMGHVMRDATQPFEPLMEAEIAEIEVYGKP
ncbi:hypothetical protein D6833_14105 [Candidatus Parcubacteria bacterium]|nr:MAG: hypothetical protein D6833_14105 [Candidatus Parcubacteria bacterium]